MEFFFANFYGNFDVYFNENFNENFDGNYDGNFDVNLNGNFVWMMGILMKILMGNLMMDSRDGLMTVLTVSRSKLGKLAGGGSKAVAVGISDMQQVTGDKRHLTPDT